MADEATLNAVRAALGYTDAQWEKWRNNPRNLKIADNLEGFHPYFS